MKNLQTAFNCFLFFAALYVLGCGAVTWMHTLEVM